MTAPPGRGGGPEPARAGEPNRRVLILCDHHPTAARLTGAVRQAGLEPALARSVEDVAAGLTSSGVSVVVVTAAGEVAAPPRPEPELLHWGALAVDTRTRAVSLAGTPVRSTPAQFALLVELAHWQGAAVATTDLAERLYGRAAQRGDRESVRAHVRRLRRQLCAAGDTVPGVIATVRGYGYRLR